MKHNTTEISRRDFLKSGAIAAGAIAVIGAGTLLLDRQAAEAMPREDFLRPPGAIDEEDFLYGCIKCGLCVQICPVQAIKLAGAAEGLGYGTPYIDPREQACDFSCDALQCVETCPTSVLDFKQFKETGLKAVEAAAAEPGADLSQVNPFEVQKVAMKNAVNMGKAVVNKHSCLAHAGKPFRGVSRGSNFEGILRSPNDQNASATPLRDRVYDQEICHLCVTECPIGEKAIVQTKNRRGNKLIPRVLDGCTGCGVCQMVCPTEKASIVVEPF